MEVVKWYEAVCGYLSFPFIAAVFFWYGATLQTCRPKIEMALKMGLRSVNKINKPRHVEVIMGKLALAWSADLSRLGCVSSRPPVLSFAPRCESSKRTRPLAELLWTLSPLIWAEWIQMAWLQLKGTRRTGSTYYFNKREALMLSSVVPFNHPSKKLRAPGQGLRAGREQDHKLSCWVCVSPKKSQSLQLDSNQDML